MLKFSELKKVHTALVQYMKFFEDVKTDEFNILFHCENKHSFLLTIKENTIFNLEKIADENITAVTHENGTDLISWLQKDKDEKCRLVNKAFKSWIDPLFRNNDVKLIHQVPKPEEQCHCIWFSSPYGYFSHFRNQISLRDFDYKKYCEDGSNAEGGLSIPKDLYSRNVLQPSEEVRQILRNYKVHYKLIECTEEKKYRMMEVAFLRNKEWTTSRVEVST